MKVKNNLLAYLHFKNSLINLISSPYTNINSFYEKTFASASVICILFAIAAAKAIFQLD